MRAGRTARRQGGRHEIFHHADDSRGRADRDHRGGRVRRRCGRAGATGEGARSRAHAQRWAVRRPRAGFHAADGASAAGGAPRTDLAGNRGADRPAARHRHAARSPAGRLHGGDRAAEFRSNHARPRPVVPAGKDRRTVHPSRAGAAAGLESARLRQRLGVSERGGDGRHRAGAARDAVAAEGREQGRGGRAGARLGAERPRRDDRAQPAVRGSGRRPRVTRHRGAALRQAHQGGAAGVCAVAKLHGARRGDRRRAPRSP
jgi:hypothetical protein